MRPVPLPARGASSYNALAENAEKVLRYVIEKLSNRPALFLFCRSILEGNFRTIRQIIRQRLAAKGARRVLDLACGPGAFSNLFRAESYCGVDINEKYIRYARRHHRGSFRIMDARRLEFPSGSFDDALIFGLLHHLNDEDASAVLEGLSRVLEPPARVLVIEDIPAESRLNLIGHLLHRVENGRHIRLPEQYRLLVEKYFRVAGEELFRSGICDYYMASLVLDGTPRPPRPAAAR